MPSSDDGELVEVALDGSGLEPVSLTYRMTMEMGGQSMSMDASVERSRTTHNEEDVWRVETSLEGPMGKASDVVYARIDTLRPVHRTIDQGPISMALDFAEDAITGTVTMPGGNTMDVDVVLDESLVSHTETALAVMPLEPGFRTRLRIFEPGMQQIQQINVAVVAAESVDTPAGNFETFQLNLESADGSGPSGKAWVTQTKPHLSVKSETTLPPMAGGARMVTELTAVE